MEKYTFEDAYKESEKVKEKAKIIKEKRKEEQTTKEHYDIAERSLPGELEKIGLPKIYEQPYFFNEKIPAVVYNASNIINELKKQRENLGITQNNTLLVEDISNKFNRTKILSKNDYYKNDETIKKLLEVEPDFLETSDHKDMLIYTDDTEKLSHDLLNYFKNKITYIATREDVDKEEPEKNVSMDLLKDLEYSLSVIKDKNEIDHKLQATNKQGRIDIVFSIYPEIEHCIATYPAINKSDKKNNSYSFLNIDGKKFEKNLHFHKAGKTRGGLNLNCDILTQLELLEYLKTKGHAAILTLANPEESDDLPKEYPGSPNDDHYSYAI